MTRTHHSKIKNSFGALKILFIGLFTFSSPHQRPIVRAVQLVSRFGNLWFGEVCERCVDLFSKLRLFHVSPKTTEGEADQEIRTPELGEVGI